MGFKPWRGVVTPEMIVEAAPCVGGLLSAKILRIDFQPNIGYSALNPSIHGRRCIVRTVNYGIAEDGSLIPPADNVFRTRNVMLELDGDLRATEAVEMLDFDQTPRSDFPTRGYEDCRLFSVGDQLRATATVCDFSLDEDKREMVLLELGCYGRGYHEILKATPLRGAWSRWHQKNWMPKAHNLDGKIDLIYSIDQGARFEIVDKPALRIHSCNEPQEPPTKHRGSSQLVEINGDYLCVVHDTYRINFRPVYLHRFVLLDRSFRVLSMTDRFWFVQRGIEFCAGLTLDGSRLVASFGVGDNSAWFAVLDVDDVLDKLLPV